MLKRTHGKLLTIYMQLFREQFQFKMFDISAEIVLINPPILAINGIGVRILKTHLF
jgi:hypothetical protein